MSATEEETRAIRRRSSRGLEPVAAAVVIAVVVAATGAAGYVVLSEFDHGSTASTQEHSCRPASSPLCGGPANTTGIGVPVGAAAPLSRG